MDRRGFLAVSLRSLLAGSVIMTQGGCTRLLAGAGAVREASGKSPLSEGQWSTVAAVQAHLLPSEPGRPGAAAIHARSYLQLLLEQPGPQAGQATFVADGVRTIEALCMQRYQRPFPALDADQAERVLRQFEQSPAGDHWLTEMLEFLMEALLGDPSYGGNPDGIGWRWLDITPGFPRPPGPGSRPLRS